VEDSSGAVEDVSSSTTTTSTTTTSTPTTTSTTTVTTTTTTSYQISGKECFNNRLFSSKYCTFLCD
jgi:hypothetical protein